MVSKNSKDGTTKAIRHFKYSLAYIIFIHNILWVVFCSFLGVNFGKVVKFINLILHYRYSFWSVKIKIHQSKYCYARENPTKFSVSNKLNKFHSNKRVIKILNIKTPRFKHKN